MRRKILIIHPLGTISSNPNIRGIVEVLCEKGYRVDIWSRVGPFNQSSPCRSARLVLRPRVVSRIVTALVRYEWLWLYKLACRLIVRKRQYQLVIGVDREGVIEAQAVADVHAVRYGMISYEIMFEEEVGKAMKQQERAACKDLAFAVCQDRVRSKQLAVENGIALDNIIDIPVAGRSVVRGSRAQGLREELNIPHGKKVALYAGFVGSWTMIDELLDNLGKWPDDWVLVLHCFAGMNKKMSWYVKKYHGLEKLYVSSRPVDMKEMYRLMRAADLGIALYKPRYHAAMTGKNIEYMGMSSGKISTYLQHGLPVLVNEIGEMANYVRDHRLGIVVGSPEEIPGKLEEFNPELCRENCYSFFEEKLDLDRTITPLLNRIDAILSV